MALRLHNSLTRRVEAFETLRPGKVSIYICGMTPSAHPHLGHARTFLTFDVLRRHLEAGGWDVTYVQNVTDIDDRIIERARAEHTTWDAIVTHYFGEYTRSADTLGIRKPDVEPRATQEMSEIIEMIRGLIESQAAYETADGVYFSVKSFSSYGQLSNRDVNELRSGERIAVREDKRDPLDFALWKKAKPGEPTWQSPWGPGRPGWHIECSAMSRRYLGDQIDIHGGATDLIFPHHENEVAQSESFSRKHPMARFWVHAGLLMVDGRKMSKSLGNFTPLPDVLRRHPAAAIRFLFLQSGYRKPINFTEDSIGGALRGLRGLYADLSELRAAAPAAKGAAANDADSGPFDAFLDDDLNTAGALGWLRRRIREGRALDGTAGDRKRAVVAMAERCLERLGLAASAEAAGVADAQRVALGEGSRAALRAAVGAAGPDDVALVERVIALIDEARGRKDFARSDALRSALAEAGITVRNTSAGTQWSVDGSK